MKRLIIIVEGDTELEFVNTLLAPYLYSKAKCSVSAFKIKHSKGGLSNYNHLRIDLLNVVYQNNVIVTTLIDYYGLPSDFPQFQESASIVEKQDRIKLLESGIKHDIESVQGQVFENLVPYIQLHEFEALVFSSSEPFKKLYDTRCNFTILNNVLSEYTSPEDINHSYATAPSKRLSQIIRGYIKIVDGNTILQEIGIQTILNKCPRFNQWVEKLIFKTTNSE